MKKANKVTLILLTLTLLLTAFTTIGAAQPFFPDVKDHWGKKSIEKMATAGIINGYPNGTFKPNDPVMRLHTIYMLARVKELDDKVNDYNLSDFDYQFPPNIQDATQKKYLAVAVEEGWLLGSGLKYFNPRENATRQEVASFIALAFNLRGDFNSLPFTDKNNISTRSRSYVAGVYEAGILQGRTPTTFAPQEKVKRAELAIILDRVIDQGLADQDYDYQYNNEDNNSNDYSDTGYFGKIKELTMDSIKVDLLDDDDTETYDLSDDVRFYDEDEDETSLLSFSEDDYIRFTLSGGDAESIYMMEDIDSITGKIIDLEDDEITVAKNSSKDIDLDVDDDSIIVVDEDGDAYDYDDLEKGYKVEVTYSEDEAIKIRVLDEEIDNLIGTIYSLRNDEDDEDDWELELLDIYGDRVDYDVDEDVDVYDYDGDKLDFWDLDDDDRDYAVLHLNRRNDVEEIALAETIEGVIEDLDDDDIEVDGATFDLSSDIDIENYLIGSEVRIYVHDDEVLVIEVKEDEDNITVPGKVDDIDDDHWEITIEQDSDNEFTFEVDDDVDIIDDEDGDNLDFDDIDDGWEVELELDDGVVTEITVIEK
ncbi:MAG: S-layer homology domain-containing protein [Firmicutes bacterium]|nr:S-layer homology domain-containing protein [Bacillota bacterium]